MIIYKWSISVSIYLHCCLSFRIDIKKCLSAAGTEGVCRLPLDCFAVKSSQGSSNCSTGHICCPKSRLSESRCDEYGDAVYGPSYDPYEMDEDQIDYREDECGVGVVPLIIGGLRAEYKEFPHMAAIGYGSHLTTAKWLCGGALVSESYILTAAHCLVSPQGEPRFVKLGVINLMTETSEHSQVFKVNKSIPHPRYTSPSKWHDIALIKLDMQVKFTPFVRPACLDYDGEITVDTAVATGWGYTGNVIDEESPNLLSVELDIAERSLCNRVYYEAFKGNLTSSLLCAGTQENKDTCYGDSGGPLQTIRAKPYCMYSIIGVTSFGISCGHGFSSVYTRVFHYLPWLESVIWRTEL
uniref:Peptidase S1 domain-containing protein n=1 Tax=Graphocephala atropunctata TaxID=36148 RepID=A0A1B6KJR2_9HEMI